ncbi:hypothetical protein [Sphingobacterium paucimobilis]|nr:hypothetical protein [Sphingobacterium paucimobilis]
MKKIMLIMVILSFLYSAIHGQQKGTNLSVDQEIDWLLYYKREYEKYSAFANVKNDFTKKNINKKDSIYKLYTGQIEYIRKSPDRYLTLINSSIQKNKVEYDGPPNIVYDYVNFALPYDSDLHSITRLELYQVIKKYLFDQDDTILPHRTEAYIKAGGKENLPMPLNR